MVTFYEDDINLLFHLRCSTILCAGDSPVVHTAYTATLLRESISLLLHGYTKELTGGGLYIKTVLFLSIVAMSR
jgi:hypothetical protein